MEEVKCRTVVSGSIFKYPCIALSNPASIKSIFLNPALDKIETLTSQNFLCKDSCV